MFPPSNHLPKWCHFPTQFTILKSIEMRENYHRSILRICGPRLPFEKVNPDRYLVSLIVLRIAPHTPPPAAVTWLLDDRDSQPEWVAWTSKATSIAQSSWFWSLSLKTFTDKSRMDEYRSEGHLRTKRFYLQYTISLIAEQIRIDFQYLDQKKVSN